MQQRHAATSGSSRFRPGDGEDDENIEPGEDDAGNHGRSVQLGQRLLGRDGVDRQQHGRRNEHIERARPKRRRPRRTRARSRGAAFPGSPPWRRSPPWRWTSRTSLRTAHRRRSLRSPTPRECPRTRHCTPATSRLAMSLREATAPMRMNSGIDRERVGAGQLIGHEADHLQGRGPAAEGRVADEATDGQRDGDRDAGKDQQEQGGDAEHPDRSDVHRRALPRKAMANAAMPAPITPTSSAIQCSLRDTPRSA